MASTRAKARSLCARELKSQTERQVYESCATTDLDRRRRGFIYTFAVVQPVSVYQIWPTGIWYKVYCDEQRRGIKRNPR